MQSRRKIERRNKRNATMVINFNPEEPINVKDVSERKDVRIDETSSVKIQIENRQFNFLNTRALFENNRIARNSSYPPVIKQDQIVETEIEQNKIKPNNSKTIKLETTNDKESVNDNKAKETIKDHVKDHDKEAVNDNKAKETIKDHVKDHDKEAVNDNKAKETIKDHVKDYDKESVNDNKAKETIKDYDKTSVDDKNSNNDRDEEHQQRMFPFEYLKNYWKKQK